MYQPEALCFFCSNVKSDWRINLRTGKAGVHVKQTDLTEVRLVGLIYDDLYATYVSYCWMRPPPLNGSVKNIMGLKSVFHQLKRSLLLLSNPFMDSRAQFSRHHTSNSINCQLDSQSILEYENRTYAK